jgi:DNA (cytosine-5)-methyltransferase 1
VAPFTNEHSGITGMSLCAGYAGLDLGLHIAEPSYRTVCYVEREAHAAATLVARMADKALAQAAIWDDLKTFDGLPWRRKIHILSAGYPCQPFSFAGLRKGADDPRHLWPDIARIINEVAPEWVFAENVEGHLNLGCSDVCQSLRKLGYTPKAGLFTARETGASHRRGRVFILAHANCFRQRPLCRSDDRQRLDPASENDQFGASQYGPNATLKCGSRMDGNVVDFEVRGVASEHYQPPLFAPGPGDLLAWQKLIDQRPDLQPAFLRNGDGMAHRLDEGRGAGNGVCSLAAAFAYRTLKADFVCGGDIEFG